MSKNLIRTAQPILPRQMRLWIRSSGNFRPMIKRLKATEPTIPIGADPSLSDDALDAAFALLSSRIRPQSFEPVFEMPPKGDGVIRVGLLVPLSGEYAALGMEIRRSVEMALFKINNPKIEILFLDTKGGETAGNAAITGLNGDVDIFIGPLFT
jgi:ABC-type branched-subunit amino acid transport system substrate-binding protein